MVRNAFGPRSIGFVGMQRKIGVVSGVREVVHLGLEGGVHEDVIEHLSVAIENERVLLVRRKRVDEVHQIGLHKVGASHEILIGVLMFLNTPVTYLLLGRAALRRERGD